MQRRHVETGAYWTLGLLAAYLLSTGPVQHLVYRRILPEQILVIYLPLEWTEKVPTLDHVFKAYLQWWCRGDLT